MVPGRRLLLELHCWTKAESPSTTGYVQDSRRLRAAAYSKYPYSGTPWIFSTSSTTAPPLPAGISSGTWKWVSSPDGKGYFWSFIPSVNQPANQQMLPDPPTGGSDWIFSTSSTTPPPLPVGTSSSGTWKWVSAPNGNGYYWSYTSSPQSPQQQLPPPQSGSTEWIFSPSKTTPPSLPAEISGTSGTWKWVSAPNGNGYYWSFTPSSQQLPASKPGSTGWVFSPSNTTPPMISGISGSGSWTWIHSQSGNGYYWSWTPGAPQGNPAGFQGGFVTPDSGTTGRQGQGSKPDTSFGGSFDSTKPGFNTGTQGTKPDTGFGGSFNTKPGTQGGNVPTQPDQISGGFPRNPGPQGQQGGLPINPGQQGNVPFQSGQQGGVPVSPGQQGNIPLQPGQGGVPVPGDQGNIPFQPEQQGDGPVSPGQQGGSFPDHSSQGDIPINPGQQGGVSVSPGQPFTAGFDQTKPDTSGSGNIPSQGGNTPQGGSLPQSGDQGVPIKGPFGGSFDQTGRPVTGGDLLTQPGTQGGSGNVPIQGGDILQGQSQPGDQGHVPIKGPFGGSFDHTGKPITGDNPTTGGAQGSGNVPIQGGDVPQGTGSQPQTGYQGQAPINGPFGGSFDQSGKPIDTTGQQSTGGVQVQPSTGDQPIQHPGDQGQVPIKGPFGGSFDQTGKPIEAGGSTSGSHSSGGIPIQQPDQTGDLPSQSPQTGGTGSIPSTGDAGVIQGPFGGAFDQTGKPIDTTVPIQGGSSTSGSHESGGIPVQQPGQTGETPLNPDGSHPSAEGEDVIKGPFGGSFDSTGKPVDIPQGSQGSYKCPPRSRIELLDAPTVPEAVCPICKLALGIFPSFEKERRNC